jgi:phospholipid N-methyltransferase
MTLPMDRAGPKFNPAQRFDLIARYGFATWVVRHQQRIAMPPSPIALARASRRSRGAPSPYAMFLKGFIRNPGKIGSIIPSSRRLVDHMLAPVDWAAVRTFVEYGPGVGPFIGPVLEHLAPDATYVAIDADADFVRYLRRAFHDPRLHVVHGSAADVATILGDRGLEGADHVVSGLPFSTLPAGVGEHIVAATHAVLRPGGALMAYQTSPHVGSLLAPVFPRIETGMAWWNIPPARLYWAWKDAEA